MRSAFAAMLLAELNRRKVSKSELARQSGCGQPFVSLVLAGQRRPSLDRVRHWSEVLELDKATALRLLRLAGLVHVPDDEVRADLERLVAKARR